MNASMPARLGQGGTRYKNVGFDDAVGSPLNRDRGTRESPQLRLALLGANRDQAVRLAEYEARSRTVDPAHSSLHGKHEHAGLGLEPEFLQRAAGGSRARLHD